MKNIIEVKNLTKEYKSLKAIDDLSFEVKKGDRIAISRKKWNRKIKYIKTNYRKSNTL